MSEENTENVENEDNNTQETSEDSKEAADGKSIFLDSSTGNDITLENLVENISGFSDLTLNFRANLGNMTMPISQFLRITRGSILELGIEKNGLIDIQVNKKKLGNAEIMVQSENIAIKVQNIFKKKKF